MVTDLLGREISKGDIVVSFNCLYEILEVKPYKFPQVKMILINPSKTTQPVTRSGSQVCLLDKNEVLVAKLKGKI